MKSNAKAYRVPEYVEASKRRALSKFSALDYFVSEWEPSLTKNSQSDVDRWRDDLIWCMLQAEDEADQRVADVRGEAEQEMESVSRNFCNIILVLSALFCLSTLINVVHFFTR
jgi:hypothetical protein